ncbi:MAG: S-methyl-5-thioribose-1-phosphate isomerase, partial [Bacteroidales bacterium]|nr:S-methyl-5-thioribose-1-phosphate isomerase [Bacteroidales bacterium]
MIVEGKHYRTIWIDSENEQTVKIIDQRKLPFVFEIESISTHEQMAVAIQEMHLRGAGLIGAAGAYGMYLAALESLHNKDTKLDLQNAAEILKATRPTAVNLSWAVDNMLHFLSSLNDEEDFIKNARYYADSIANQDANACKMIGEHGLFLIRKISKARKKKTVNILTHCNAGWLAFVDFGSALAPIYAAFDQGIDVHVWVDETRPRNQGARLTAWELGQHGVKHTLIAD